MEPSTQTPIISHFVIQVKFQHAYPDTIEYSDSLGKNLISALHLHVVEQIHHKFSPIGVTIAYILSTSHFTLHTWPEYEYIHFDILSCALMTKTQVEIAIRSLFRKNDIAWMQIDEIQSGVGVRDN